MECKKVTPRPPSFKPEVSVAPILKNLLRKGTLHSPDSHAQKQGCTKFPRLYLFSLKQARGSRILVQMGTVFLKRLHEVKF